LQSRACNCVSCPVKSLCFILLQSLSGQRVDNVGFFSAGKLLHVSAAVPLVLAWRAPRAIGPMDQPHGRHAVERGQACSIRLTDSSFLGTAGTLTKTVSTVVEAKFKINRRLTVTPWDLPNLGGRCPPRSERAKSRRSFCRQGWAQSFEGVPSLSSMMSILALFCAWLTYADCQRPLVLSGTSDVEHWDYILQGPG